MINAFRVLKQPISFSFEAVKRELDDSVEFVSAYVRENANNSIIYEGPIKMEPSSSDSSSYVADISSADSSANASNIDYTAQLYELYNSRRSNVTTVAPVLQEAQGN